MKELLLPCLCVLSWSVLTVGGEKERVVVREGDDALLPCSLSTNEDLTLKVFDWKKDGQTKDDQKEVFLYYAGITYNNGRNGQDQQFKGRVIHFEDKLKNGDASITIRKTTVADSGNYTCDFPRHQPRQTFLIELVVVGAAPKPYIRILEATKDKALLQCEAEGPSPRPAVWWQDSAGKILDAEEPRVSERGGRYHVTLLITVTRSDHFSCVVSQQEIHHQTSAQTFVFIDEDSSIKVLTGWLVGTFFLGAAVLGVVFFAVLAVLVATKRITLNFNKGSRQQGNGSAESCVNEPLQSPA